MCGHMVAPISSASLLVYLYTRYQEMPTFQKGFQEDWWSYSVRLHNFQEDLIPLYNNSISI